MNDKQQRMYNLYVMGKITLKQLFELVEKLEVKRKRG